MGADAGSLVLIGKSLVALHNWTFLFGPGFADGIGTGMILGWLMYRSGLVGRRMALFGVVGGPLLAASGIAVLLGVIPQGSALQGIATVPEIVWEAFLGLYLTFRAFKSSPILASDSRGAGDLAGLRRRLNRKGPGAGLRGPSLRSDRIGSPRPLGRTKGSTPMSNVQIGTDPVRSDRRLPPRFVVRTFWDAPTLLPGRTFGAPALGTRA